MATHRSASSERILIVTCEHGGHAVPRAFATLFEGQRALLESHRGWDRGALALARHVAQAFGAPCFTATTTRLLVDLNRSLGHRALFSEFTRPLARSVRQEILARHYRPYRDAVEGEIARHIAAGRPVLHVSAHSFTPVLDGDVRRADVACLYDPQRPAERELSARWLAALTLRAPALRLRRNYPYQGRSDGFTAHLRRRFADAAYAGLEVEVNQARVAKGGRPWAQLRADLVASLAEARPGVAA